MKGKTLNEFIDALSYGCEMEFKYKEREFIIQGEVVDNVHTIRLDEYGKNDNSDNSKCMEKIIRGSSFEECAKILLNDSFIDDKTLFEIEEDIEVLFG